MNKLVVVFILLLSLLHSQNSNQIEIIHGHILPLEPDPKTNNATLGGVDSNDNGVRDDVERAIYKKYDKKIHALVLMQKAKFLQRTLVEPTTDAKIIQKDSTKAINCTVYLSRKDQSLDYTYFKQHSDYIKDVTFNTVERIQKYANYNIALSGGMYGGSFSNIALKSCSQEIKDTVMEMGL